MKDIIWQEHKKAHFGSNKVYHKLKTKGYQVTKRQVEAVVKTCLTCAKFWVVWPRGNWGQPPYSIEPGHTIFSDVIGDVTLGRQGVKKIIVMIDSCTKMSMAVAIKQIDGKKVVEALKKWQE